MRRCALAQRDLVGSEIVPVVRSNETWEPIELLL
jgi:hypothetical protein